MWQNYKYDWQYASTVDVIFSVSNCRKMETGITCTYWISYVKDYNSSCSISVVHRSQCFVLQMINEQTNGHYVNSTNAGKSHRNTKTNEWHCRSWWLYFAYSIPFPLSLPTPFRSFRKQSWQPIARPIQTEDHGKKYTTKNKTINLNNWIRGTK